jgi:hypothetical protein
MRIHMHDYIQSCAVHTHQVIIHKHVYVHIPFVLYISMCIIVLQMSMCLSYKAEHIHSPTCIIEQLYMHIYTCIAMRHDCDTLRQACVVNTCMHVM